MRFDGAFRIPVMPNLQIRDLPQELYDALKLDARLEQRSLTQQAIVALREARQCRRSDRREQVVAALGASGRRFEVDEDTPEALVADDRRR
jgi:plasmid stability protein